MCFFYFAIYAVWDDLLKPGAQSSGGPEERIRDLEQCSPFCFFTAVFIYFIYIGMSLLIRNGGAYNSWSNKELH